MALQLLELGELTIEDEPSFLHVGLYRELKARLLRDEVRFAVPPAGSPLAHHGAVQLMNLAFWQPGDVLEIFADRFVSADQLAHGAWHHAAAAALGPAARSADGLLLAEAIASAFDAYLVGRLLGHAPDSSFLETQVPAMMEAALDAGMEEQAFEALLEDWSREPEAGFETLRQLLFSTAKGLLSCADAGEAAALLQQVADEPLAPLLYHYELPTWVLYARAYGSDEDAAAVGTVDEALRQAPDALEWLEREWLS